MKDGFGRTIDYARISVTDRCNLRCVYCMPCEGVESVGHNAVLNYDEIMRLVNILADLGIDKIKITGGEPLVRKNVSYLIKAIKETRGIRQVTVTTNGILLKEQIKELKEVGVDGINLSLDTLDRDAFCKISRRDQLSQVLEGFYAALDYPEIPLKINCVPMGIENQNVLELAELARKHKVHVRYIEMMPIGLGQQFQCMTEEVLLKELKERYGAYQVCNEHLGNGPGHYYVFPGFMGKIGFISAMTHKFCSSCNRVRLTSQGYLKTCLQYDVGCDLRAQLRDGSSDEEIRKNIEEAVLAKPLSHRFGETEIGHRENHMMSQIGG